MHVPWNPRPARLEEEEIAALEELISLSVEGLQAHCYTPEQRRAAMGPVFGVDRQLITDGTYYVVEAPTGEIVGCGGWSRRKSMYGGSAGRTEPPPLQPGQAPARIRAFFIHPAWARQGIGRAILLACENALVRAGFTEAVLNATLPGVPLYQSQGYERLEEDVIPLEGAPPMITVLMRKEF
jgi:GNAT superfamily N-acetyltransferase